MHQRQRTTSIFGLVILAGLSLSAIHCGKAKEEKKTDETLDYDPTQAVTLTFGASYGIEDLWKPAIDSYDFQKRFPNVAIQWQDSQGQEATRIATCVQDGTCNDIEAMDKSVPLKVAKNGENLVNLAAAPYNVSADNFVDNIKGYVVGEGGELWGAPIDSGPVGYAYRIDLLTGALQKYNGDHPTAALAAASEADVINTMNNLSWDDYLEKLSPYLYAPDGDAGNGGFPTFPIFEEGSVVKGLFYTNAPGMIGANGELTTDALARMRRGVDLRRRFLLGQNSGALTSGYDLLKSYFASYHPGRYLALPQEQRPCQLPFDNDENSENFFSDNLGFYAPYGACVVNSGMFAMMPIASWFRKVVLTGHPYNDTEVTGNSPRDNYGAWAKTKYRIARPFGLRKGGDLSEDIPHLVEEQGGTVLAVTKATKYPKLAAAIVKYLTLEPQNPVTVYKANGPFPVLKTALADPIFNQPEPAFGGQTVAQVFAQVAADAAATVKKNNKTPYDSRVLKAFNAAVNNSVTFDADLSDAGLSALQNEVIGAVQAELTAAKQ